MSLAIVLLLVSLASAASPRAADATTSSSVGSNAYPVPSQQTSRSGVFNTRAGRIGIGISGRINATVHGSNVSHSSGTIAGSGSKPTTTAATTNINDFTSAGSWSSKTSETINDPVVKRISVGLLVPYTRFKFREYQRAIISAMNIFKGQDFTLLHSYRFNQNDVHVDMLKVNPSPTGTCVQKPSRQSRQK